MSATILSQKQNDAEKFSEFKAKKLAQKEAQKEKLAAEFPLLFGKDAKARSTVGKYANKTFPTTPNKKKALGNSTMPSSKVNEDKMNSTTNNLPKKTPKKELNALVATAKNVPPPTKIHTTGKLIENNENKTSNTQSNTNKPSQGKKGANKGFFHFLSSKPTVIEEPAAEISQESLRSRSKDLEDGIEIPTMNDFTQPNTDRNALIFSVVSEDSLQPQITTVESFPSQSIDQVNMIVPEVEKEEDNELEMILDEKVQDALDFMLESKELDPTAHRRLSGQRFSAEVIRRFSVSNLPRFSNSMNNKPSISADVDFHAISRDISEEETMMLAKRSAAPLTIMNPNSNESPVINEADCESRMNSVMTNPMTTPALPDAAPEITTGPDAAEATESTSELINESNMEGVIGDLEVLYALRNYISSLDEMTFYSNPMRNSSYLKKRKSSVVLDPQVTVIGVEPALEEEDEHPVARSPKIQRTEEPNSAATATCFEEIASTEINAAPEENNNNHVESLMQNSHMDLVTPVSFLSNGIADNRIIHFPRQTLFDELFKLGLVYGEISSRIRCENHVKYVIDIQIFPVPAGVIQNHPILATSGVSSTRMMLLKRFTEFKEFREQLILCQENNENKMESEPIPSLPSKQSMSLSHDCNEEEYLNSRQRHLNIWLSSILARQSYESDQYRDTLYDFFNN